MTKRRDFIRGCGSALAIAATPASWAAGAQQLSTGSGARQKLSKARFLALLNEDFRVCRGRQALLKAKLMQVKDVSPRLRCEQFTVEFRGGNASERLTAGIYDFRHRTAGRFQIYIEPVTDLRRGDAYTASFNLLT